MILVRDASLVLDVARRMREWDRREIFACMEDGVDAEAFAAGVVSMLPGMVGWHIACLDNLMPVAFVGFAKLTPVCLSVNVFATDDFGKLALPLTRWLVRQAIPDLKRAGFTRAECRALQGHVEALRWLEQLGAHRECECPRFGKSGETYIQMAWEA